MTVLLRTATSPIPSSVWIDDANFHAGQRLADGVRAKRLEIVDRDRGAGFGEAVAVGDRNSQIVEKLQRLRLRECATDNDGAQFAAKRCVHLLQQDAG